MLPRKISIQLPKKLKFLAEPHRYKVARGGRGGAKSHSFASQGVLDCYSDYHRFLCTREVQKSIKDSVHKLICDKIEEMNIGEAFEVTNNYIKCYRTKSEFLFEGLHQNINRIKSIENISRCWVEEAHAVTEDNWKVLLPTIRGNNAEVWISFNPEYEDDATYKRWVVNPPDDCVSVLVNYYDNPWFPEVLEKERQQDEKRLDKDSYEHIWLGKPRGMGGKVWPLFKPDIHIRTFEKDLIRDEGHCFMAMDPHSHYYPFCVWLAVIPKNKRKKWPEDYYRHIYAEWPTYDDLSGWYHEQRKKLFFTGTLKELAIQLQAKDGIEYGYEVKKRFIDSRYAKGSGSWSWSNQTTGIVDLFSKPENGGLLFNCPAEKLIDSQRQKIHDDMTYNMGVDMNPFNEPSFSIDPSCKNTIMSFKNHKLEEDSEKEAEKYKEASDCTRILYAGIHNYQPEVDAPYEPPPVFSGPHSWMA